MILTFEQQGGKEWFHAICLSEDPHVDNSKTDGVESGAASSDNSGQPPEPQEYEFSAGNYYVGEDIPAGRYDVIWISGRGNCFGGGMIETFGESEHAIKEYRNVELKSGDKVEVSGTLMVKFTSK